MIKKIFNPFPSLEMPSEQRCHASSMALWMAICLAQSSTLIHTKISQQLLDGLSWFLVQNSCPPQDEVD